jgi:hypothetical protein
MTFVTGGAGTDSDLLAPLAEFNALEYCLEPVIDIDGVGVGAGVGLSGSVDGLDFVMAAETGLGVVVGSSASTDGLDSAMAVETVGPGVLSI